VEAEEEEEENMRRLAESLGDRIVEHRGRILVEY